MCSHVYNEQGPCNILYLLHEQNDVKPEYLQFLIFETLYIPIPPNDESTSNKFEYLFICF